MKDCNGIPNGFFRTSIKALILNENKGFLLIREDDGNWELPGGALNFGEKYADGIKRELKEEMGLTVTTISQRPHYITTFINFKGFWTVNIIFEVEVKDLNHTPSEECQEIGFFHKDTAMRLKLLPSVKAFLEVFDPANH